MAGIAAGRWPGLILLRQIVTLVELARRTGDAAIVKLLEEHMPPR